MRTALQFLLCLCCLFVASSSAVAQEAWQEQLTVQTKLKSGEGYADLSTKGFSLVDVAKTEVIMANESSTSSVMLAPGSQYVIMGVCDNDCSDLDLALMKGGMELDKDTTTDDWPILVVTPTSSPNYEVKVTMYACSTANCGYQLSVWKK